MTVIPFSVLLSVYKGTSYHFLNSSLESIFNQNYHHFEIIIVLDGELTVNHYNTISYWKSKLGSRLIEVKCTDNVGLAIALNKGIQACNYEWIARMDADDIMTPDRLSTQNEFIVSNMDVDVVGSWIDEYDEYMEKKTGTRKVPVHHQAIVQFGKWRCPMNHMSVCYKKKAVMDIGGYNENLRRSQDYALWANFIVNGHKLANIPKSLVEVRTGTNYFSNRNSFKVIRFDVEQRMYMLKIGFLNTYEFLFSLFFRITIRVLPLFLVKTIYKYLRFRLLKSK